MGEQEIFERILGSLNEAMLDDAHWPATAALVDEALGSKGNIIGWGSGGLQNDIQILFSQCCFRGERNEDLERLYFGTYFPVDERVPRIMQLPDSRIVHVGSLYTDEEKKTSPAYNEVTTITHTRDSLHVCLDGPDASRIGWVIADRVDDDGWSADQIQTIERLLPHVRQFMRVRHALVNAQALGSSVTALLENTRCGVIQLDPRGRIVAANDRARDVLRKGDGLADQDGLLRASLPAENDALQALLARVLPPFGGQGESGSMTVRRATVSPRLVLHASPVTGEKMDQRASRVAAIVLVVDPSNQGRIDPDLVAGILGLTPAEARVAVMLAQGLTVRNIAAATGRTQGTVRTHIKHIFDKHEISRQVQLVQLVISVADMPQARGQHFRDRSSP